MQLPHREGSGNRLKTELVDHHEDMRALVDDFKGLALVKQQDAGHGAQPARVNSTKTLHQWLHGGYMTTQKRKSPVEKPGQVVVFNGRAWRT